MGPQGNPGPVGPTGPQGSQGPAGGPGPSGPQGSQGPVGPQGPKGNDGTSVVIKGSVATHADLPTTGNTIGDLWIALDTSHGWVWSAGNIWADVGPIQGPAGPAGAAGPTGAPGAAATIAVGTTSTGAAGSAAAVTNVGSSSAAVFNFVVPQGVAGTAGPQGIPGNEGDQGPQGPQGIPGAAGSPGAQGPQGAAGAAGPPGPTAVSANTGNVATLGSDSLIYVPDPASEITSVRLRSFNAIGNPNFEVCQRNTGALLTNPNVGALIEDRWALNKIGASMGCTVQSISGGGVPIPGLNFNISRGFLRLTLTAAQASLAASDQLNIFQYIEGARFRELSGDAHSVSLLVRSSVAGLKFGLRLGDSPPTTNLTKLCTIPNANTWTLISLPNLPVWPSGNFSTAPGVLSYLLCIVLAAGATITAPANDTWQAGANFLGAVGQSNFAASPVNSTFDIAFVQHEPGPLCSTLIDKPFAQNYDECLRYYAKSFAYAVVPTATFNGAVGGFIANAATAASGTCHWPKRLARTPGVIGIYSPQNGAANTMYNLNSGANASAVVNYYNEVGLLQLTGSGFTVGNSFAFHYTADTGW
jgi:Collagen triple helix repeat (20 copies)